MARVRSKTVYVTTEIEANIPLRDVMEGIDTTDLIDELKLRANDGEKDAAFYLETGALHDRDRNEIRHLIKTGQAQELLALMTRLLMPHKPLRGGADYSSLPLCISTRRPIIL